MSKARVHPLDTIKFNVLKKRYLEKNPNYMKSR